MTPPVPTNVSVSFGAGSAFLTRTTEGRLDPSPVTQSMEADQRIDPIIHGLYDEPPIRVTTDAAHLDVGADWALQVSARGRFAGSQRIFSVIPGELYQAKIRLKPLVDGEYTLVFRDLAGNFIANTSPRHTPLTAGVYGDLIVADLRIPEGVNQVIMRAAVVDENPMTWQTHWTNWQHAELILGMPPANPGVIVGMLHADAEEREAGTWLNRTFSNTVDSDGTAWPNEYSYQADGFAMYLSDVVADMADLGYECTITRMATPSGGKTHDFNLFVPGGAGEDRSATGPTLMTGGAIVGGTVVDRLPAFTAAVAWGPEDLHSSSVDATTLANIGRLERFFDAEQHHAVESLDTFLAGQFSDEERNRKAAVARLRGGGSVVPGRDFDLGDTLVWQAPGRMVKNQRRAQVIAWRHGDPVADYEVHGSRVWDGQAAVWKAVERLIDAPKKRRRHHPQHPLVLGGGGGIPDVVIAAANTKIKKDADLVCTGQDDHLTFRRALDLLPDEGGWIHFLQGVYDWGEPVMLDGDGIEGLKVTGAGQGLSILRVADEAGMHSVFWTGGSVDAPDVLHVLTVEDLTIDGNKANATITGGLLTGAFGSENDVWLTRVELRNSSACGLGRADAPGRTSNRWFITDCNIHHNDTIGMVLDESLSNIKGTTTHNNGSHGMRALFGGTHRFTGSESRNNGGAGISGAGLTGTACFIVVGSDIRNNAGDGIAGPLISSIPSLIVANRIINNGGQSVNVWSTSVVEHNLIFGNGTDAPSPATGLSLQTVTFSIPGELTAGTGVQRWVASRSGSVLSARVAAGVGSGPVGDDLILDVNKNGSSVFEFIADQPVVEDGEEIGDSVAPTLNEDFVEGDWFTIDVDQVGSTDPGSHVTLMMEVGYL